MLDLGPEGTLVAYQLTLVLGGWVPEALASHFAMSELESLLKTVDRNVARVVEVYDPEEYEIEDGDGVPIDSEALRQVLGTDRSLSGPLLLDQFEPDIFLLGRPPTRR